MYGLFEHEGKLKKISSQRCRPNNNLKFKKFFLIYIQLNLATVKMFGFQFIYLYIFNYGEHITASKTIFSSNNEFYELFNFLPI
jgi:hypothetical protein